MSKCLRADCNEPRMRNRRGNEMTYCAEHQRAYWAAAKQRRDSSTAHPTKSRRGRPPKAKAPAVGVEAAPVVAAANTISDIAEATRLLQQRSDRRAAVGLPTTPPPAGQQRIAIIDPDTNRATVYDVIAQPALFVVPTEPEAFAREFIQARERGVIVAFKLSEIPGYQLADAQAEAE